MRIESKPGEKISALVVDDEEDIREMLVTFLETMEVFDFIVQAGDGAEGIRKVQNQKFDLIITDLIMPNVRGIEFIQHIKMQAKKEKVEEEVPIIILSGNITGDEVKKAIHLGIRNVVTKPCTADEFTRKVTEVMAKFKRNKIRILKDE